MVVLKLKTQRRPTLDNEFRVELPGSLIAFWLLLICAALIESRGLLTLLLG